MPTRTFYNWGYRWFRMPWESGPRQELVALVNNGTLPPGRAVDLGCGTGANALFLAQHGFEVTGVDFAPAALHKARARATAARVGAQFIADDLTDLQHPLGPFDLLVDYSTLDDLSPIDRQRYIANVLPMAAPKARFLLWCFQWSPRPVDRWLGLHPITAPEIQELFGSTFRITRIAGTATVDARRLVPGSAAYLMTRNRCDSPRVSWRLMTRKDLDYACTTEVSRGAEGARDEVGPGCSR